MRLLPIALALAIAACADAPTVEFDPEGFDKRQSAPEWAAQRIAEFESGKDTTPLRIQPVTYLGAEAFLFLAPCCDRFNYLYDRQGNRICAPTGGLTGNGDGRCSAPLQVRP
jgi:hypothetical protein